MRLLVWDSNGKLSFTKNIIDDVQIPPYAILSHTWQEGQEITFDELQNDSETAKEKLGYEKIHFCARQAQRANLRYIWVDTCCINKAADLSELQEALNSMFKWYQRATECYVYLSDVSISNDDAQSTWEPKFRRSRWFRRGWTLQELLAPRNLIFFSREGIRLGNKRTLEQLIHDITGISVSALRGTPLSEFGVKERMSWITGRETTRKEDKSYSLLGIFNVFMLPNYGEGEEHAFKRLQDEISKLESPWLVPFPRPQFFVGRKIQLAQTISHILAEGGQRLAMYGLGGCGKTALTLESVYQTKEQQPARAIFWISAVSRESFEQGYQEMAALLGVQIAVDENDNRNIKQRVKERLEDLTFGQWLMIVDNADNPDVLYGLPKEGNGTDQLVRYLPISRKGSIIFTTRTREAAFTLAGSNVLALGELDRGDAAEVLQTRLLQEHQHQLQEQETVDEFLSLLSYLALAIVQAVAYINVSDISLSDYITHYRTSEKHAVELLSKEIEDPGRYRNTRNAIATTWFISFEEIQLQDSVAADYLSFMACVANNDIPVTMLPIHYTDAKHLKAICTLKAYAFVAEQQLKREIPDQELKSVKMFNVHPLVHLSIRGWLKAYDQWDIWRERVVARLLDIMPYGDEETRPVWTMYLPHAQHVVNIPETRRTKGRLWLLEVIGACEKTIWYEYTKASIQEAAERGEELLGKGRVDVSSVPTRAKVMIFQHNEDGARKLCRDTITTEVATHTGKRTHTLLACVALSAWALNNQSRYDNAELLLREQLAWESKAPGSVQPEVLVATLAHLGIALRGQNKTDEGNKMLREALTLDIKCFGEPNSILESLGQVGRKLNDLAKFTKIEEKLRETLAMRTNTLGIEHPQTMQTLNNLSSILRRQCKYKEAEDTNRELITLNNKLLGREHPETLRQRSHLASILALQTRYAEAVELERETLALKDRVLGEEHPHTLLSVVNLADFLDDDIRYDESVLLYKRASIGYRNTLGPNHRITKKWTFYYNAMQEVVDLGEWKTLKRNASIAATASTVPESKAPSTSGLATRPKDWWRPDSKRWKAGKETLQRWFTDEGKK